MVTTPDVATLLSQFEERLNARIDGVEARLASATQQVALDAVTKIVSGVTLSLERQLRGQLVEMQADLDLALDKLDCLEHDVRENRTLSTQIRREMMKDVRRTEAEQKRAIATTTEVEALKYRIGELAERLDALEGARE